MKFTKIVLTLFCSLIVFCGCAKNSDVVLKINDKEITRGEFYGDFDKLKAVNLKGAPDEMKKDNSFPVVKLKSDFVNDVIVRELLRQEFEKRNITVTDKEFQDKKAQIMAKIGSQEQFENKLREYGVTEEKLRSDLEDEVRGEKLFKSLPKQTVSNSEIQKFYNDNKQQFIFPQRVRVSHILIDTNPSNIKRLIVSADKEGKLSNSEIEAKVKAEVARKEKLINEARQKAIKNPKKFPQIASEYSEDKASAMQGGDMGYIVREQVVKEFGDAAFSQKVGVVGPLVRTQFGQHIILVTDKAAGGMQPLSEVKADLKAYLIQQKTQKVFNDFIKGLKDKAKIEYVDETLSPEHFKKELDEAMEKFQKFKKNERAPKSKKKILDQIEKEQKAKKEAQEKKEDKK